MLKCEAITPDVQFVDEKFIENSETNIAIFLGISVQGGKVHEVNPM